MKKSETIFGRLFTCLLLTVLLSNNWYPATDSLRFPLAVRNYWEYIEQDTTTLFGYNQPMNFSVILEVIADTTLSNNLTYQKIRIMNYANSVNYPAQFEFQRVDSSGNIHHFYNNQDYILYDFSKNKGETYPSCYANKYRKVLDVYTRVYTYNNISVALLTFDFGLFDEKGNQELRETVADKLGLVGYGGTIGESSSYRSGNFYGGFINGKKYGELLVRDTIDWREYFPLQTGNFWKYSGYSGSIPELSTVRVIGDTIIAGETFKIEERRDLIRGNTGYSYVRLAGDGSVYQWQAYNNTAVLSYKFRSCIGDTSYTNSQSFCWRINNKDNGLEMHIYPDLSNTSAFFNKGVGYTGGTGEMTGTSLTGAVVNGVVYGDTTITAVKNNRVYTKEFALGQCYPNPFNPSTQIHYYIAKSGYVSLIIYDILGREIQKLVQEFQDKGNHVAIFNGSNSNISSGIYFYTIKSGNFTATKKMLLLK